MQTQTTITTTTETQADRAARYEREQARRTVLFNLVADRNDWRAKVDAVVPFRKFVELATTVEEVEAAIVHFTGTVARSWIVGDTGVQFRAVGYRAGPCGP